MLSGVAQVSIKYIANIRLPTEKAHGAQIMKTCEALARAGAQVELVVPARRSPISDDPFLYYGVEKNFSITRVPVLDLIFLGRVGFWIESLSFAVCALVRVWRSSAIIYSRDELPLFVLSFFKRNIVWETHGARYNLLSRRLLRVCKKLVVISGGLKHFYESKGYKNILVAHDAIDLAPFEHSESKEAARRRLNLPQDKKVALYVGRVDGWKGTETLFEAAKVLPSEIVVAVIGGEEQQIKQLRAKYPQVMFLGFRPYRELADNQAAADVLVLPNTAKDETSAKYTSPMKLFSYMAASRPVVASDLQSLKEVLDQESAFFFTPDDSRSLAATLQEVFSDPVRAERVALQARKKVEDYTWDKRAATILAYLA